MGGKTTHRLHDPTIVQEDIFPSPLLSHLADAGGFLLPLLALAAFPIPFLSTPVDHLFCHAKLDLKNASHSLEDFNAHAVKTKYGLGRASAFGCEESSDWVIWRLDPIDNDELKEAIWGK